MKHNILLPTDFSDNSWKAILYAINLYKNEPCNFYLLHTWTFINSGTRTYITTSYIKELKKNSEKELAMLKEKAILESNNSEHTFKAIFTTNDFLDCIKEKVKKYTIDMIIMGTKGSSGVSKFLFGSNTVTLMNKIENCPILAVPDECDFVTPKHIGFPTDYNRAYGDELKPLKKLSELYTSKIRVLHIGKAEDLSETQKNNLDQLKTYLEEYPHRFYWTDNDEKKQNAIDTFIRESNIDILTMVNYKHSFIENIVKEPIIKKIGFNPKIPFLVIPSLG